MSADETRGEAHARGQKEGRIDALLEEHTEHLSKINGSVEDAANALARLETEVHKLDANTRAALADLETALRAALREVVSDIRTLNEEGRIRDERVRVAADTLETETERRRKELATTAEASDRGARSEDMQFTRRQGIAVAAVATALTIVGIALSQGWL
jgi:chromosome segregation ATPase